jgi:hypothetical protein
MPLIRRQSRTPKRAAKARALSSEWRAWLAENLLLAVPRDRILGTLAANGIHRRVAELEIDAALRSPILIGAERAANRARRYSLVARLERETGKLVRNPREIERRAGISRDEFFERYYAAGVPVVLTDTFEKWPALGRWSPASLKERFGSAVVEVTTGRDEDPATHTHFKEPSTLMRLGDFCDRVLTAGPTNALYLISDDFDASRGVLAGLLSDIGPGHPYIDDERDGKRVLLWFGPQGTVTPLHHDTKNVFLCQAFGRKRVILFPRSELPLSGALPNSLYAPIDLRSQPFPELADALRKEVTLSPGEALFIPVGCFHQVYALDVSISLGFSNFRAANRFEWYQPGVRR